MLNANGTSAMLEAMESSTSGQCQGKHTKHTNINENEKLFVKVKKSIFSIV